jgi:hypothetical protein
MTAQVFFFEGLGFGLAAQDARRVIFSPFFTASRQVQSSRVVHSPSAMIVRQAAGFGIDSFFFSAAETPPNASAVKITTAADPCSILFALIFIEATSWTIAQFASIERYILNPTCEALQAPEARHAHQASSAFGRIKVA